MSTSAMPTGLQSRENCVAVGFRRRPHDFEEIDRERVRGELSVPAERERAAGAGDGPSCWLAVESSTKIDVSIIILLTLTIYNHVFIMSSYMTLELENASIECYVPGSYSIDTCLLHACMDESHLHTLSRDKTAACRSMRVRRSSAASRWLIVIITSTIASTIT
jgi:hypothetical protein